MGRERRWLKEEAAEAQSQLMERPRHLALGPVPTQAVLDRILDVHVFFFFFF